MLTPQWLDELRSRVTLSSVIMRTTKLQKAGREWNACCPFHNEKTPSFTVNDEKGFYHCFGCQAHGDVIRWMTDQRGLSFMDAVKELAAEAGMEVPAPGPRSAERAERQHVLHDVIAAAQAGQHENGRATWGHSMIVDPWGKIVGQLGGTGEGVLVADIDPAATAEARSRVPALSNARPFSLSVNPDSANSDPSKR